MEQTVKVLEKKAERLSAFENIVRNELLTHKILYGTQPNWPEIFLKLKEQIFAYLKRLPIEIRAEAAERADSYFAVEDEILAWKKENITDAASEIEGEGKENIAQIGSRAFKAMAKNVGNDRFWGFFDRLVKADQCPDAAREHKRIRIRGFFGELFAQRIFEETPGFAVIPTSIAADVKLGVDFVVQKGDTIFVVQTKSKQLEHDPDNPGKFIMPAELEKTVEVMPREGAEGWERKIIYFVFGASLSKGEPTEKEMITQRSDTSIFKMPFPIEKQAVDATQMLLYNEDETGRYSVERTTLQSALAEHVRKTRNIWIDAGTAERLATTLQKAIESGKHERVEVSGIDVKTGSRRSITISSEELYLRIGKRFFDESSGELLESVDEKIYVDYKVKAKLARACREYAKLKSYAGKKIIGITFWAPYISEFGNDTFFVNEKGELRDLPNVQMVAHAKSKLKTLEAL